MLCKQRIVYSQTKHIYAEQTIRFVKHISKTITITKKRHSKIKKSLAPATNVPKKHQCDNVRNGLGDGSFKNSVS